MSATGMYDLGDFGKAFDTEKVTKAARLPRLPSCDFVGEFLLKRVVELEGDRSGKFFEFRFTCTKANDPRLLVGKTYTDAFFVGASKVDREACWKKMTPVLVAAVGGNPTNPEDTAKVPATLGEFLSISKEDGTNTDLDLPVRIERKMEPARADKKTGQYDPKHLDTNGKPKIFARTDYDALTPAG